MVHDVVLSQRQARGGDARLLRPGSHGNVWYFGEATKSLTARATRSAPKAPSKPESHGARAGVLIPGHPRVGQVGRQEFYAGEAEDHFKVLDLSARSRSLVSTHAGAADP